MPNWQLERFADRSSVAGLNSISAEGTVDVVGEAVVGIFCD